MLDSLGARHPICCGVSTAYVVGGTVRQATDIGYDVTVTADACSTATRQQHEASLQAMRVPAEIRTADELLRDFRAESG